MRRYSRQRDAIIRFLTDRTDHPTAEIIYQAIRQEVPNISMGTVYRNLSLLESEGEIKRLSGLNGSDRFDIHTEEHGHLICSKCGAVEDVPFCLEELLLPQIKRDYQGMIEGGTILFYGTCSSCTRSRVFLDEKQM